MSLAVNGATPAAPSAKRMDTSQAALGAPYVQFPGPEVAQSIEPIACTQAARFGWLSIQSIRPIAAPDLHFELPIKSTKLPGAVVARSDHSIIRPPQNQQ